MLPKNRKEWIWIAGGALFSILVVGLINDFEFSEIVVRVFNSSFTVSSFRVIVYLALLPWTINGFYHIMIVITDRYKVFTMLLAVILPIVALFNVILIYKNLETLMSTIKINSNARLLEYAIPMAIMFLFLVLITIMEIKFLRDLSRFR